MMSYPLCLFIVFLKMIPATAKHSDMQKVLVVCSPPFRSSEKTPFMKEVMAKANDKIMDATSIFCAESFNGVIVSLCLY